MPESGARLPMASQAYALLNAIAPAAAPHVLAHERFADHEWFAFEFVPGPS